MSDRTRLAFRCLALALWGFPVLWAYPLWAASPDRPNLPNRPDRLDQPDRIDALGRPARPVPSTLDRLDTALRHDGIRQSNPRRVVAPGDKVPATSPLRARPHSSDSIPVVDGNGQLDPYHVLPVPMEPSGVSGLLGPGAYAMDTPVPPPSASTHPVMPIRPSGWTRTPPTTSKTTVLVLLLFATGTAVLLFARYYAWREPMCKCPACGSPHSANVGQVGDCRNGYRCHTCGFLWEPYAEPFAEPFAEPYAEPFAENGVAPSGRPIAQTALDNAAEHSSAPASEPARS